MPDAALAFTAGGLVLLALAVAVIAVVFRPPPQPALAYAHCNWCQSEDHTGLYCPRRGEAAQVIPQPRAGHSGNTVELKTLFASSRNRWDR